MRVAWLVVLLSGSSGCQQRFVEEFTEDGLRHLFTRTNSKTSGTAVVKVPLEPGETAMLATASVDGAYQLHFRSVRDSYGFEVFRAFEWNQSPYSKTNAGFVADTVSLNWPVAAGDTELIPGRWELEFGVVDAAQRYAGQPVFLDILFKQDGDLSGGSIDVALIYTGDLIEDTGLVEAVDEARGLWRDLYARAGIEVSFQEYRYPAGDLLPPAFGEEEAYADISASTPTRTLNIVLSERVQGYDDIFGIAGDIPGPLMPTTRSAVQISTLLAAGPDGQFDSEDTRLLAETMAHEAAHFLGLFHPVETTWDAWDVLDDTSECERESRCVDQLGDNLMFPFPVCGPVACTPQDTLTGEQSGVMNRYTGTY